MIEQPNSERGRDAFEQLRKVATRSSGAISAIDVCSDQEGWIKKQTTPPTPDETQPTPDETLPQGWIKKQTTPPTPG